MKSYSAKVMVNIDTLVEFAFQEGCPDKKVFFIDSFDVDNQFHDKFCKDFGIGENEDAVQERMIDILNNAVGGVRCTKEWEQDSTDSIFVTMIADIDEEIIKSSIEQIRNYEKMDIDIDERE